MNLNVIIFIEQIVVYMMILRDPLHGFSIFVILFACFEQMSTCYEIETNQYR